MLYCNPCADVNCWPKALAMLSMSYGKCEICGNIRPCNDVPSSALPGAFSGASVPPRVPVLTPAPQARPRRTFQRLVNPLAGVRKVRTKPDDPSSMVFTAMDEEGHYWSARGWESGVAWTTLMGWGPLEEVLDDDV
jgi:hypothetical protein